MTCQAEHWADLGPTVPARVRMYEAGREMARAAQAVMDRTRERSKFGPDEAAAAQRALRRARTVIDAALGDRDLGED